MKNCKFIILFLSLFYSINALACFDEDDDWRDDDFLWGGELPEYIVTPDDDDFGVMTFGIMMMIGTKMTIGAKMMIGTKMTIGMIIMMTLDIRLIVQIVMIRIIKSTHQMLKTNLSTWSLKRNGKDKKKEPKPVL